MRPTINAVKIELDKERTLRFDFNALSLFEEATGLNSLDGETWQKLNARSLKAMLWSALKHEDDAITLSQVGAMIHKGNVSYITEKITEAYKGAAPTGTDTAEEDGGKNATLPTG
jgi:hypothetical protein